MRWHMRLTTIQTLKVGTCIVRVRCTRRGIEMADIVVHGLFYVPDSVGGNGDYICLCGAHFLSAGTFRVHIESFSGFRMNTYV